MSSEKKERKNYAIADIKLAPEGHERIDWAWQYMPVLRLISEKKAAERPLAGKVVAACLHLEAKTACLLIALKKLGAEVVACGSNPLSTQDPICAAMAEEGIHVYSRRGMTTDEYFGYVRDMLPWEPDVLIDDGGDVIALLHEERPDLADRLLGACEETTTGIKRIRAMEAEGVLRFPVIAVNDAKSKHLFDNRYGTGQSTWDAIMRTTNLVVAGKCVVVAGYGWCGRGVAARASGLGARVVIVECDPHRALEALMDGHAIMDMDQASAAGDVFVTVTGNTNVVRAEHMKNFKDGVILANAGHFNVEISIPGLESVSVKNYPARANVQTYEYSDGRRVHLIGEGRLANLAAGDGHPVEIMDMSFAIQLLSSLHIARYGRQLGGGKLIRVPDEIDRHVAELKIESAGFRTERLTEQQQRYLDSWRE